MRQTAFALLLAFLTGGYSYAGNDNSFSLEWNPTWRTDVPYEVSIDAAKAGLPSNLQVYADGKAIETLMLEDKTRQEAIRYAKTRPTVYRFSVPVGAKKLQMCEGKSTTVSSDIPDNAFAGSEWLAKTAVKVGKSGDGWIIESSDWKPGTAVCRVKVPAGLAGKPVVFEMDCKSLSKMTWAAQIFMRQYDASGNLLPETVYDSRWTNLSRPPQKFTPFREAGYVHPAAAELEAVVMLNAEKPANDYYGLPLKNPEDARPQLLVSRLALRPAAQLPFPKYDDSFFGSGISGKTDDCSLVMDGDRAFWFCTRSLAVWSSVGKEYQARTKAETFFPTTSGTVELWLKPYELKGSDIVLFEANNYYHTNTPDFIGPVLDVKYNAEKHELSLLLTDKTKKKFSSSCIHALKEKEWQHVAVTFVPDGDACLFVDGHKVLSMPLKGYAPLDLENEEYPNDIHATQVCIGAAMEVASEMPEYLRIDRNLKYFKGEADLFRASDGVRYSGDFTPARSFKSDSDTRALFDFNRSFDGVSGGGIGWISGTINAPSDRVDHVLVLETPSGERKVQYYPATLLDEFNPDKVFEPRVKEIPSEKQFAAADVCSRMSFDMKPGEKKTVKAPEGVYTDYYEIANTGNDILQFPAIVRDGDIDSRSYGDIAESLDVPGATDRQKADRFFNFLLTATDYFMTHQIYFEKDSDIPKRVAWNGMVLLNTYCGFECGPLNTTAISLFSVAAGCPSNSLAGYGHSFEHVYFDGKPHHYDLSAQQYFPSMDNESAASLADSDQQEYIQRRLGARGSHFTRRSSRTTAWSQVIYPEKFSLSLNPGERIRIYNLNDGVMNDLTMKASNERRKRIPFKDYTAIVHAPETLTDKYPGVRRVDRFFPEYGTAFLSFDGKPETSNPAFKFVEKDSFCYDVKICYPAVAAEYTATLRNGKTAALELSTDGGKTFRAFTSPATYQVRARMGYLIRICAPISEVVNFKASTQMQLNSRVITGRLKPGDNELTLKATSGTSAKITYGIRTDGKPISFDGAVRFGAIVGCEKSLVLLEPSKGRINVKVNGITSKARVAAADGVDASLKNGVLTVSSKNSGAHMGWVTVADGENMKTLCVMVCDGARLAKSGAELVKKGDKAIISFEKIKAGDYKVYTLQRLPVDIKYMHQRNASILLGTASKVSGCMDINNSADLYKDIMGPDGGRGVWRWDSPLGSKYSYPYQEFKVLNTQETDRMEIESYGYDAPLEIADVLIVPENGEDFDNEIIKYLFGRNHRPWSIAMAE